MTRKKLKNSLSKVKITPSPKGSLSQTLGLSREGFALIPLSQIEPNPNQPRKTFSTQKLKELELSIRERGVIQPIRVRAVEDKYQIVVGERRWRASKNAGIQEIPAVIVNQEADQAYIDALLENVLREDLNPIDRAEALFKIRVNLGLQSWEELGGRIGLSRQYIHNLLGLTKLPEAVQNDIREGKLNEKHGRALKTLIDNPEGLKEAYNAIKKKKLSGDDSLELVRSLKGKQRKKVSAKIESVKKLSGSFSTKISSVNIENLNKDERSILINSLEKTKLLTSQILEKLNSIK